VDSGGRGPRAGRLEVLAEEPDADVAVADMEIEGIKLTVGIWAPDRPLTGLRRRQDFASDVSNDSNKPLSWALESPAAGGSAPRESRLHR